MIPTWFHSKSERTGRRGRRARRPAAVKLRLERFEERTVPAFLPTNYAAGAGAAAIVAADFQGVGDGTADFATANITGNTVSVFLNRHDGSGTFQPAVNYAVAGAPVDIVAGDLTGDGLPDIVVTDANSNTVTILYNNPAHPGTFQPRVGLFGTGGNEPLNVRLADLNGDGFLDIITANYGNNTVGVLLNDGAGNFAPAHTYPAGASSFGAYALAVADFYGDGFDSVAVSNPSANTVDILRGNGDGTLQRYTQVASPGLVTGLAAGDLGNGAVDLVTANNNTGGVNVLLNDGAGHFTSTHYNITPIQAPLRVVLGDVNGDGNLDVVTDNFTSTGPGNVSILYGNGDGTLQAAFSVNSGGNQPSGVAVADVEGDIGVDQFNDILISNNASGNATVLLHNPAPVVVSTTLTGEFNNQTVSGGDVIFSDPIDLNTFVNDFDEFSLTDPHGNPVRVNSITPLDSSNMRFHVTFAPQSGLGTYTVTIGPDIYDPTDRYRMPAPFVSHFSITNNLIVNGGFESGSFSPGWTQVGDTSFSGVDSAANGIPVHSGNYAAFFGPTGSLGGISQTVTTTPGQTYQLSLWLDHPFAGDTGTEYRVQIGGTVVDDQHDLGAFNYTQFTYSYTATGTSTTIQLEFLEPPAFFYLDDVSFSATGAADSAAGAASHAPATVAGNATSLAQHSDHGLVGTFGLPAAQGGQAAAVGQQPASSASRSDGGSGLVAKADPATGGARTTATPYHVLAAQVLAGDPFLADLLPAVL